MGKNNKLVNKLLQNRIGSIRSINWESILNRICSENMLITDCIGPQAFEYDGETIKIVDIENKNIDSPSCKVGFVIAVDFMEKPIEYMHINGQSLTTSSSLISFFEDRYWITSSTNTISNGTLFFPNKNESIYREWMDDLDAKLISNYITDVLSNCEIDHRKIKDVTSEKTKDASELAHTLGMVDQGNYIMPTWTTNPSQYYTVTPTIHYDGHSSAFANKIGINTNTNTADDTNLGDMLDNIINSDQLTTDNYVNNSNSLSIDDSLFSDTDSA